MNKLLSKALAKTFALHVLATTMLYVVPFRLNFLVFHLIVLVWLLITSGRNRSPYFYGITVLMSIMALGTFMHESFLLPIFYLLLLPYWVQSGRYAIRNVYAIPITSLFRLPAMFNKLEAAYKVYHWSASKGSWHGIWLIGCLCVLVILQLILVILTNSLEAGDSIDLCISTITNRNIASLAITLIPIQFLIQLFIRNASTRFDGYYKVKSSAHQQSEGSPHPIEKPEKMGPFAWITMITAVGFGVATLIPFLLLLLLLLFLLWILLLSIFEEVWLTLLLVGTYAFILHENLPGKYNQSISIPSWKHCYSLIAATIISLHMALPYEHLLLFGMLNTNENPSSITGYVRNNIHGGGEGGHITSPFTETFYNVLVYETVYQRHVLGVVTLLKESRKQLSFKNRKNDYRGTFLLEQLIIDEILAHPRRDEILAVR